MKIDLYASPGSCSKVPLILLEQANAEFTLHLTHLASGAHKTDEYRKINSKGKVPALVVDGITLTENPVIIQYLASQFSQAKLLPKVTSDLEKLQQWSDLCFCSSGLHPIVVRICKPEFFTQGDAAIESVKAKGMSSMDTEFEKIDARYANRDWWYGSEWSAVDVYIYWVYTRVQRGDYDVSRYPNFVNMVAKMEALPAVQRAIVREQKMLEENQ